MKAIAISKAALVLLLCAIVGSTSHAGIQVRFNGKRIRWEEPPPELAEATLQALQVWGPFAEARKMRIEIDKQQRFLLVAPGKDKRAPRRASQIAKLADRFDRMLPAAQPVEEEEAPVTPVSIRTPIPEDPEDDWEDPFADEDDDEPAAPAEAASEPQPSGPTSWGTGQRHVADGELAVMVCVDDKDDYAALLQHLVERFEYLRSWAGGAVAELGFALQVPLAGCVFLSAPDLEEWSPDHELAHRAAQLLLTRRFGTQPNWLVQGVAWELELETEGSIYCFPHRTGFVGVGEHSDWQVDVRLRLKQLERPLSGEDFLHWKRGTWSDRYAKFSWGLVKFMIEERPAALGAICSSFLDYAHEHNRRDVGGGQWERIIGYEIPLDVQESTLRKAVGADVWEAMAAYYQR